MDDTERRRQAAIAARKAIALEEAAKNLETLLELQRVQEEASAESARVAAAPDPRPPEPDEDP